MKALLNRPYSKRLAISISLLVLIAAMFWSQSRFPDLNDKALMGGGIVLEDPLSFEAAIPINPHDPVWKRITVTTYNWIMTNLRGMTFGILFGAAFLTMLRYLRRRSFKNGFANALMGFLMGAPLGVCVNCAAPIARGIYSGGARLETTLAAMIASPTFNVIVLSMLFSLFPFYLVMIKIGLTVAVILVAIPIICRFIPASELQLPEDEVSACLVEPVVGLHGTESVAQALTGFARDLARDLWFILRMTVPLMLLAGFLGAALATLIPVSVIQGLPLTVPVVIAVTLIGVFLPVPIAFDIVFAAALLAAGAPVGIVMAMLFTLGIFSVYSFMIIANSISLRASVYLTLTICVLGLASSYAAESYNKWQVERTLKLFDISFDFNFISSAHASEPTRVIETASGKISVSRVPFEKRSPAAATAFTRLEAWKIGVDRPNKFSMGKMHAPFVFAPGSISAADIDNDGDADLIMANNYESVDLFINDGTGRFKKTSLELPEITGLPIVNAAPVDLNNDGWLDLFLTTYNRGNYVLWSAAGRFSDSRLQPVANQADAIQTLALAFGDIDRDSDMDVVLGNHTGLPGWMFMDEKDRNRILINDGGRLDGQDFVKMSGTPGETLSLLLSDIDQDGDLDLIEANDFEEPDIFYFGDGKGGWRKLLASDALVPVTTHTTMSVKTADLDNDTDFEIYFSQIAGRSSGISERLRMTDWENYCSDIERSDDREACQANIDIKNWYPSGTMSMDLNRARNCLDMEPEAKTECAAVVIRDIAFREKRPDLCDKISEKLFGVRNQCRLLTSTPRKQKKRFPKDNVQTVLSGPEYAAEDIPQYFGGNVLLVRNQDGRYENIGISSNLDIGGWSWDVKIYDFDHDGLQDIHILNGAWPPRKTAPSNIFMLNRGALNFEDRTEEFGLIDYLIVTGSAAADFDNDGDIDEIVQTINGPVIAYWNNTQSGNAIAIELRDETGNRFGIGSKVRIHYGAGKHRQIRELKLSGGYGSFDEAVLHFGLGKYPSVDRIEIEWSNHGTTVLDGPFDANATYRIGRLSN